MSIIRINALRSSASAKLRNEHVPPLGKLALLLLTCDATSSQSLIHEAVDFVSALKSNQLLSVDVSEVPIAAMTTAAVAADTVFFFSGPIQGEEKLLLGSEVVLPPLSLLSKEEPSGPRVVISGLPHVIQLPGDATVATHWFAKFQVEETEGGTVTLGFQGLVEEESFLSVATDLSVKSNADEKHCQLLERLQSLAGFTPPPPKARPAAPTDSTLETPAENEEPQPGHGAAGAAEQEEHAEAPAPEGEEGRPEDNATHSAPQSSEKHDGEEVAEGEETS
jgi:hypothetical protein